MPSKTNAIKPDIGISIAHNIYGEAAVTTSILLVISPNKLCPPSIYNNVNAIAIYNHQRMSRLTVRLNLGLSSSPYALPHNASAANAKPSMIYENIVKKVISKVFTERIISP